MKSKKHLKQKHNYWDMAISTMINSAKIYRNARKFNIAPHCMSRLFKVLPNLKPVTRERAATYQMMQLENCLQPSTVLQLKNLRNDSVEQQVINQPDHSVPMNTVLHVMYHCHDQMSHCKGTYVENGSSCLARSFPLRLCRGRFFFLKKYLIQTRPIAS